MAMAQMDTVIRHLRRAVLRQDGAGRTDGQLLASFLEQKDQAAFEALVRRHGPMVFGVCRRVVRNHHDAEDAFQATFLVLARKASSVRPRERVANWLHGVALRTARKAQTMLTKRRGREKQVTEMPEPEAAQQDQWRDLQPLLDQELNGLPENYRLPILLCDLEGKTINEAAQQLGWRQGTLAGRLARGRKLLAKRLASRGVVLSAGSLAAVVSQNVASAGVPTSLMFSTVEAAGMIVAGQVTVAGVVPAKVAALMEGVMKGMMLTKLSNAVAGLVVLGAVVFGGSLFTHCTAAGQQQNGDKPAIGPSAPLERDAKTVAEAGGKQDAPRTDLERLQGVWSVVSIEQGGKPAKLEKAVFMVDGKRACWQTSEAEMQGGLYLDPTSKPRTWDFVMSTRTMEGIYSLDGDTLRLCYNLGTEAKRPVGFATEKGSQQVLFVLKRIHGPEVFPYRLLDGTRAFPPVIERVQKATPPPQEAPTPKDNARYDPGLTAPGREEPPATKNRQQDFPVQATEGKRITVESAPEQYSAIYEKTLGVLSDHFKIDYANRFDGRIDTCPAFVDPAPDAGGERAPSLRRRAVACITPLSVGGFSVEVIVLRERRVVPPSSPFTAAVQWEAAGRDHDCERKLLAQIGKGFAVEGGKPDTRGSSNPRAIPSEPPLPRPLQPVGPTTVTVQNARIVIAPGVRIRLESVKTASGGRVRLEMEGITIEVPRLTIESDGKTTRIEASEAGDSFTSRTVSTTEKKEIGPMK
jgi:RNA polymerase sigma-70 factor (ECF subfamily)